MTQIGLPVPPAFVITTKANADYLVSDSQLSKLKNKMYLQGDMIEIF